MGMLIKSQQMTIDDNTQTVYVVGDRIYTSLGQAEKAVKKDKHYTMEEYEAVLENFINLKKAVSLFDKGDMRFGEKVFNAELVGEGNLFYVDGEAYSDDIFYFDLIKIVYDYVLLNNSIIGGDKGLVGAVNSFISQNDLVNIEEDDFVHVMLILKSVVDLVGNVKNILKADV